ncbi:hypothetical protein KW783_03580 [Candidatus Parcubacteria bacterium]|nr:hypothetical protein [Candidatus Parcubacteria bacterium]
MDQELNNKILYLPEPDKKFGGLKIISSIAFLILASCALSVYVLHASGSEAKITEAVTEQKKIDNPFDHLAIEAKGVYVWDTTTQKALYSKDSDSAYPLASVTKLMTALTARTLIPDYTVIKINRDFLLADGDSGLRTDESWKLKDLLDLSLTSSSNDGALAISSVAGSIYGQTDSLEIGRNDFIAEMNRISRQIGLVNSHFENETGLDISSSTSGAYGSAHDIARLLEYEIKKYPDLLEATRYSTLTVTSLDHIVHIVLNTNPKILDIPGILASKTGYTDLAGGNVAVAFTAGLNHPIIVVLLGSTYDGRFTDLTALVNAASAYVSLQNSTK